MWKNMTWLAAEWRYYFEWRKMAFAARLEGNEKLPERNTPWKYTAQWIGVAVAVSIAAAGVAVLVWLAATYSETAMSIAIIIATAGLMAGLILWIGYSIIKMVDHGPSYVVEQWWKKTNDRKGE